MRMGARTVETERWWGTAEEPLVGMARNRPARPGSDRIDLDQMKDETQPLSSSTHIKNEAKERQSQRQESWRATGRSRFRKDGHRLCRVTGLHSVDSQGAKLLPRHQVTINQVNE